MTFGNNLQSIREKQGLSQKELANIIGVNTGTIAEWEADDSMPSISELSNLSKALSVSSDVLLGNSSEENSAPLTPKQETPLSTCSKKSPRKKIIISIISIVVAIALAVALIYALGIFTPFSRNTSQIEKAESSVVKVFCYDYDGNLVSTGSGFFAFDSKTIITNYHVISSAYSCKISTNQDISYDVTKIACYSKEQDIAILELDTNAAIAPLSLGYSADIKKGETIVAIGSPLGIKNTVSTGVLSGRIMESNMDVLQFTAPISSGSSGGALFDDTGKVIGITFASYVDGQNLNLAIPIELAKDLYNNKGASQKISDVYLLQHPYIKLLEQYKNIPEITINELLSNPKKYDDQTIKITGYYSSTYSYYDSLFGGDYINLAFIATKNGVTGNGEYDYYDEIEKHKTGQKQKSMSFLLGDDCYFNEQLQPGDEICLIANISYLEFSDGGHYLFPFVELAYSPQ